MAFLWKNRNQRRRGRRTSGSRGSVLRSTRWRVGSGRSKCGNVPFLGAPCLGHAGEKGDARSLG